MSEINFPDPQSYDADSFGSSLPEIKPERSGNRTWLFACGGCTILIALACVSCAAVSYFGVRQDVVQAIVWAGAFQQSNYQAAELIVCEDSQAEAYTEELIDADAVLTDYDFGTGSSDNTQIDGTMEIDGVVTFWSATFIISDGGNLGGGLFGRCIEEIRVIE